MSQRGLSGFKNGVVAFRLPIPDGGMPSQREVRSTLQRFAADTKSVIDGRFGLDDVISRIEVTMESSPPEETGLQGADASMANYYIISVFYQPSAAFTQAEVNAMRREVESEYGNVTETIFATGDNSYVA